MMTYVETDAEELHIFDKNDCETSQQIRTVLQNVSRFKCHCKIS